MTSRAALQTFFGKLDLHGPQELISQLRSEGLDVTEWLDGNSHLVVRLPASHAFDVASKESCFFSLPGPSPEYLFSAGVRIRAKVVGWKLVPELASEFHLPAYADSEVEQGQPTSRLLLLEIFWTHYAS